MVSDEVRRSVSGFRSDSVPAEAADFARAVVAAAGPPSKARAKALLFATSRLGAFGASRGLELSPEVLLHPSVIERFCTIGLTTVSAASRRTVRTNLRYVAARVLPAGAGPMPLPRERAKAPYEKAEIAAYLALADAQPTVARRQRLSALVCLGAGAGLMGADLRSVRGHDVLARSGGVLVVVHGRRPRTVPVLAPFGARLLGASLFAGNAFVVGGAEVPRRNVTTPLVSSLASTLGRCARRGWPNVLSSSACVALWTRQASSAPSSSATSWRSSSPSMSRWPSGCSEAGVERNARAHRGGPRRRGDRRTAGGGRGGSTHRSASSSLAVDWTDVESFSTRRTKPDGAYSDIEAAWEHRKGGGPGEKDELFFGYYLSLATMVADEGAGAVPELVRRMNLVSCDHDPVPEFVPILEHLPTSGITLGDVVADSGYAHRVPEHFALPLRAAGANLVVDLHPNDRGTQGTHQGAIACNGNLYCPKTPAALLDLGPLGRGTSAEETAAHDAKTAELARYKLGRVSADDEDGYHRVACPASWTRSAARCTRPRWRCRSTSPRCSPRPRKRLPAAGNRRSPSHRASTRRPPSAATTHLGPGDALMPAARRAASGLAPRTRRRRRRALAGFVTAGPAPAPP